MAFALFCLYRTADTAMTINQWLTLVADGVKEVLSSKTAPHCCENHCDALCSGYSTVVIRFWLYM